MSAGATPVCPWWCITKDHLVDHDGSACPCRPEATAGFRWSLLQFDKSGLGSPEKQLQRSRRKDVGCNRSTLSTRA